jgi:hypothetical protein
MGIRLQSGEVEAVWKTSETSECNVKMDLKSVGEKTVVDWNDLAQDRNM